MSEERNAGRFREVFAAKGWRVSMTTSIELCTRGEVVFVDVSLLIARETSLWRACGSFRRADMTISMPGICLRVS